MANILPDSRAKVTRGATYVEGEIRVPFYCANCGALGGRVSEQHCNFAFWLCRKCEHLGTVAGMMSVPDELFFERVKNAQMEDHGRYLTPEEIKRDVEENPTGSLALLAREAPKGK